MGIKSREEELEGVIIQLEHLKRRVLQCGHYSCLIEEIDNALGLGYLICEHKISPDNTLLTRLQPTFNHLREMRAYTLEIMPKTVVDIGHEINLGVGMIQFEAWSKSKNELYNLLDHVEG